MYFASTVSLQITNYAAFGEVFQLLNSFYLLALIWSFLIISAIRICLLNVNKTLTLMLDQEPHSLPV